MNVPTKLRQAGITPFVVRANQLETAKPVISYWCWYWALNQVLAKKLHTEDNECAEFCTNIMDKLEQTKSTQAGNDAILDDVAGQAYVEEFAAETFERAMKPLNANRVTQQTGSTFEAAATFFQLINIWSQPDAETQEKIKFAKWNAARILRAIKEGKDPNESNPKKPTEDEDAITGEGVPALDPNDPEVQALASGAPPMPKPAAVEDAPDEEGKLPPQISPASVSAPTSPPPESVPAPDQVSPIAPPDPPAQDPEGYFPVEPAAVPDADPFNLPSAPDRPADSIPSPSAHEPAIPPAVTSQPPPPPQVVSPPVTPMAPQNFYQQQPTAPVQPVVSPQPPPQQRIVPQVSSVGYQQPPRDNGNIDDMAMAEAQKHAKWAISALNFEDVPTAVKELRAALAKLGAQ